MSNKDKVRCFAVRHDTTEKVAAVIVKWLEKYEDSQKALKITESQVNERNAEIMVLKEEVKFYKEMCKEFTKKLVEVL